MFSEDSKGLFQMLPQEARLRFNGKTDLPFQPVFVLGAPRTGTTILHALICSADSVNDYIAECSFFTALIEAFTKGWGAFDIHTASYFPEGRNVYGQYHSVLTRLVLHDIWVHLGSPKNLALKDPMLSMFSLPLIQLISNTKIAMTIRDPRDVIASRLVVKRKVDAKAEMTDQLLFELIQNYNSFYKPLVKHKNAFAGKLLLVPYEEMAETGDLAAVEAFLDIKCQSDNVWKSSYTDVNKTSSSEWYTSQYGKPLNSDSVGNYREVLDERQAQLIRQYCLPVTQALGLKYA